jgi:hypothetical protein
MGGPFDYGFFVEDLRQIVVDCQREERRFKLEALNPPDFKDREKANYDFSTP